jgi:hypothetical protein
MKTSLYFLLLLLPACLLPNLALRAQNLQLLPEEDIRKLNKAEMKVKGVDYFPSARVFGVSPNSVTLYVPVSEGIDYRQVFAPKEFMFENIDQLTVKDKKKQLLYSVIGGVAGGALAYAGGRKIFEPGPNENLRAIGQTPKGGKYEPYLAALLGIGIGVCIGDALSEVKVFPKKDKKHAYWRLRKFCR